MSQDKQDGMMLVSLALAVFFAFFALVGALLSHKSLCALNCRSRVIRVIRVYLLIMTSRHEYIRCVQERCSILKKQKKKRVPYSLLLHSLLLSLSSSSCVSFFVVCVCVSCLSLLPFSVQVKYIWISWTFYKSCAPQPITKTCFKTIG